MAVEALYLAQENALREVDDALNGAGIDYAVIKGAANRLFLYDNPALRACLDIDILVSPEARGSAALALADRGFEPAPEARNISRVVVMTRNDGDVDMHWSLLREGRLRHDLTPGMLARRRRQGDVWVLGPEDTLFALLVHPAFAKHLAGWEMGLHRIVDLLFWLQTQDFDWPTLRDLLKSNGVGTAAWATLRWAQLLAQPHLPAQLEMMLSDLEPGRLRRAWLNRWLRRDWSARTSDKHWLRLLGLSMFLHDTPGDSMRAFRGRRRAQRRSGEDLAAFSKLLGE